MTGIVDTTRLQAAATAVQNIARTTVATIVGAPTPRPPQEDLNVLPPDARDDPPVMQTVPVCLTVALRHQLRTAAFRAQQLFPGAIGECLARELNVWEEFGWELGGHAPIRRLCEDILALPWTPAVPK